MNPPSTPPSSAPSSGHHARAAEPGPHEPIQTSADGLLAGRVEIPVNGGSIPAYRAVPTTPGPHSLVLVVQEIFGLHEHIEDVVRRLARQGYLAIAPSLYARLGDPVQAASIDEVMQNFVYKTPDAQVLADLRGMPLEALAQQTGANAVQALPRLRGRVG